jgi:hypothetical protein
VVLAPKACSPRRLRRRCLGFRKSPHRRSQARRSSFSQRLRRTAVACYASVLGFGRIFLPTVFASREELSPSKISLPWSLLCSRRVPRRRVFLSQATPLPCLGSRSTVRPHRVFFCTANSSRSCFQSIITEHAARAWRITSGLGSGQLLLSLSLSRFSRRRCEDVAPREHLLRLESRVAGVVI